MRQRKRERERGGEGVEGGTSRLIQWTSDGPQSAFRLINRRELGCCIRTCASGPQVETGESSNYTSSSMSVAHM